MKITVKYFGQLKDFLGMREKTYVFEEIKEGLPLSTLLKAVVEDSESSGASNLVDPQTGQIRSFYSVMVDGSRIEPKMFGKQTLKDGDVVWIIPPVGGGQG